jgi:hypothetical protein
MEIYMHQRAHIHRTDERERERGGERGGERERVGERESFYRFSSMSQTKEKGKIRSLSVASSVIYKLPFC